MQRDMAYRIYVSDCIRILTENSAKIAGQNSPYFANRFIDIINTKQKPEKKEGDAKQAIFSKLGE